MMAKARRAKAGFVKVPVTKLARISHARKLSSRFSRKQTARRIIEASVTHIFAACPRKPMGSAALNLRVLTNISIESTISPLLDYILQIRTVQSGQAGATKLGKTTGGADYYQ
jgi:hypothetical protein